MIRTIRVEEITKNIKEMCIEANHFLSPDMAEAMKCAEKNEEAPLGKQILEQLQENLKIAGEDMIPICQDTGMAVVFLEIGQDVHLEGGALEDAVNEGVRQGYVEGYLRKSVVGDPLIRENTKDNTPAVLHTRIVDGGKDKSSTERFRKREYESCIYVETGRRNRRCKRCGSYSGKRCRTECMPANGGWCWNWWYI